VIPDYQKAMLPVLKLAADGGEHPLSELVDATAKHFALTEADRNEMLPSGTQAKLTNRVSWARTYLLKAGLLTSPRRGMSVITERGLKALRSSAQEVNNKYLEQFQEFLAFKNAGRKESASGTGASHPPLEHVAEIQGQTPQEAIENSYQLLRSELAQNLLSQIMECSPKFFEKLVVDLLVAMGYGGSRKDAGQAIGGSGDEGIDGIIKEDRLGLDAIYVQAKRWKATVGRPIIQAFAGSLEGHRARKGVFITTSDFSKEAREYVDKIEKKIILIDGQQLAGLSIDFGIGVAEVTSYTLKRLDLDFFDEE
jgi:restriction system protein